MIDLVSILMKLKDVCQAPSAPQIGRAIRLSTTLLMKRLTTGRLMVLASILLWS